MKCVLFTLVNWINKFQEIVEGSKKLVSIQAWTNCVPDADRARLGAPQRFCTPDADQAGNLSRPGFARPSTPDRHRAVTFCFVQKKN